MVTKAMKRSNRLPFLLAVSVTVALSAGSALAQSCAQLAQDLARMEQAAAGHGGGQSAVPSAQHFRETNFRLRQAQIQANQAGCFARGGFFFEAPPQSICGPLIVTIERLENELDQMRRGGRTVLNDPHQLANVNHLRLLMAQRGCAEPRWAGDNDWVSPPLYEAPPQQTLTPLPATGPVRTLCVRTCDGYYFPISFSTSPDRIRADEQVCQERCPGADTQLFYHSNPEGGTRPQDLVSLNGQRYSDLPNALKYRAALSPSCSCQGQGVSPPLSTQEARLTPPSIQRLTNPPAPPEAAPGRIAGLDAADPLARTATFDERKITPAQPRPLPRPKLASLSPGTGDPVDAITNQTPVPEKGAKPQSNGAGDDANTAPAKENTSGIEADATPQAKPEAGDDEATATPEEKPVDDGKTVIGGKSVRIVGPQPWGAPKKEEVLQAPVQN